MMKDRKATLRIERIILDWTLYPRGETNPAHVSALWDAYCAGGVFPPLVVDAESLRLIDGFHRLMVYRRAGVEEVEVILRSYGSEAEMFEDAVRLQRSHGLPLDPYDLRRAVVKLEELGVSRERIVEVVRVPPAKVEEIIRGLAQDRGQAVVVKRGLRHLEGQRLSRRQAEANAHYGGLSVTYYAKQVRLYLESSPPELPPGFVAEMERILELWSRMTAAA
jgi:hypothetical protein